MLTKEDLQAIAAMMDEKLKPINDRLEKVELVTSGTRILVENEVDRAIKVLGEGHQGIIDTMKTLITPNQLEDVTARVFALEEGFREHSGQIDQLRRKTG